MEHYIELTDGSRIEAFLKDELPERLTTDELEIDTTGIYLQHKGQKRAKPKEDNIEQRQRELELFLSYTHRFIEAADRILTDSRLFLTPVPVQSGLAYTGTSGFKNPTLGIYIEWWTSVENSWVEIGKRGKLPLYYIAGSPLSGRNSCAYVTPDGKSHSECVHNFSRVWRSFQQINTRYTEPKQIYHSYTLPQAIEELFG